MRNYKTIQVSKPTWKKLKIMAADEEITLTALIDRLIESYQGNGGRGRKAKARPKREPINTEQEA